MGLRTCFWVAVVVLLGWWTGAFRYIRNSRVGVVEKLWSARGSVKAGLIALDGEAGYQPDVLRGGLYFMLPFQYRVHAVQLVTIPQGQIGYVFARDGQLLPPRVRGAWCFGGRNGVRLRRAGHGAAAGARTRRARAALPRPEPSR